MKKNSISLRGHHLICRLGFRGLGYSESFVERMTEIVNMLKENGDMLVEVGNKPDIICEYCPNLAKNLCAKDNDPQSEQEIKKMDDIVLDALGLKQGDKIEVSKLNQRIKKQFTKETFDLLCEDCSWRYLGYCEEGLRSLE